MAQDQSQKRQSYVQYSSSCHRELDEMCERWPRISPQKRQSYVQCTIVVLDSPQGI